MAKYQNEINYRITTSFDRSGVAKLYNELSQVENKLVSMNRGLYRKETLDSDIKKIQEFKKIVASSFNNTAGLLDLTKMTSQLAKAGLSVGNLGKSMSLTGVEGQKAFNSLINQTMNFQKSVRQTTSFIDKMSTTLGNTVRWGIAAGAMQEVTSAASEAVQYIKQLDDSLTQITMVSGESRDNMKEFAKYANSAAAGLSSSTTDYTNAVKVFIQEGFNLEQSKQQATQATILGNVSEQDTATTADQITAYRNAFGISIEGMNTALDKMANLANNTASNVGELMTAAQRSASTAAAVGASQDSFLASIATIQSVTRESAEQIGNGLKSIYTRFADIKVGKTLDDDVELGKYGKTLAAVGVNILDSNNQYKGMDAILGELQGIWDTLDESKKIAVGETVAGRYQYNRFATLMNNKEYYNKAYDATQNADGAMDRMQEAYTEGIEGMTQRIKTNFESLFTAIYNSDLVEKGVAAFAEFSDMLSIVFDNIDGGVPILGAFVAVLMRLSGKQMATGITNMMQQREARRVEKGNDRFQQQNAKRELERRGLLTTGGQELTEAQTKTINATAKNTKYRGVYTEEELEQQEILTKEIAELDEKRYELAEKRLEKERQIEEVLKAEGIRANDGTTGGAWLAQKGGQRDIVQGARLYNDYRDEKALPLISTFHRYRKTARTYLQEYDGVQSADAANKSAMRGTVQRAINSGKYSKDSVAKMKSIRAQMGNGPDIISQEKMNNLMKQFNEITEKEVTALEKVKEAKKMNVAATEKAANAEKGFEAKIETSTKSLESYSGKLYQTRKKLYDYSQALSKIGGAAMSVSMGISSWNSMLDAINNKDMTSVERLETILMDLSMLSMMAAPAIAGLTNGWKLATDSMNSLRAATAKELIEKEASMALDNKRVAGIVYEATATEGLTAATKKKIEAGLAAMITEEMSVEEKKKLIAATMLQITENYGEAASNHTRAAALMEVVGAELAALGPMLAIVAAIGLVAYGCYKLYKYLNNDAQAYEELASSASNAKDAANALSESVSNLTSSWKTLKEAKDTLKGLSRGTTEWREQLIEVNSQVLDLIEKYPELAQYMENNGGQFSISQEGYEAVLQKRMDEAQAANNRVLLSNNSTLAAKNKSAAESFANNYGNFQTKFNENDVSRLIDGINDGVVDLTKSNNEVNNQLINLGLDNMIDLTDIQKEKLMTLAQETKNNTDAITKNTEAMISEGGNQNAYANNMASVEAEVDLELANLTNADGDKYEAGYVGDNGYIIEGTGTDISGLSKYLGDETIQEYKNALIGISQEASEITNPDDVTITRKGNGYELRYPDSSAPGGYATTSITLDQAYDAVRNAKIEEKASSKTDELYAMLPKEYKAKDEHGKTLNSTIDYSKFVDKNGNVKTDELEKVVSDMVSTPTFSNLGEKDKRNLIENIVGGAYGASTDSNVRSYKSFWSGYDAQGEYGSDITVNTSKLSKLEHKKESAAGKLTHKQLDSATSMVDEDGNYDSKSIKELDKATQKYIKTLSEYKKQLKLNEELKKKQEDRKQAKTEGSSKAKEMKEQLLSGSGAFSDEDKNSLKDSVTMALGAKGNEKFNKAIDEILEKGNKEEINELLAHIENKELDWVREKLYDSSKELKDAAAQQFDQNFWDDLEKPEIEVYFKEHGINTIEDAINQLDQLEWNADGTVKVNADYQNIMLGLLGALASGKIDLVTLQALLSKAGIELSSDITQDENGNITWTDQETGDVYTQDKDGNIKKRGKQLSQTQKWGNYWKGIVTGDGDLASQEYEWDTIDNKDAKKKALEAAFNLVNKQDVTSQDGEKPDTSTPETPEDTTDKDDDSKDKEEEIDRKNDYKQLTEVAKKYQRILETLNDLSDDFWGASRLKSINSIIAAQEKYTQVLQAQAKDAKKDWARQLTSATDINGNPTIAAYATKVDTGVGTFKGSYGMKFNKDGTINQKSYEKIEQALYDAGDKDAYEDFQNAVNNYIEAYDAMAEANKNVIDNYRTVSEEYAKQISVMREYNEALKEAINTLNEISGIKNWSKDFFADGIAKAMDEITSNQRTIDSLANKTLMYDEKTGKTVQRNSLEQAQQTAAFWLAQEDIYNKYIRQIDNQIASVKDDGDNAKARALEEKRAAASKKYGYYGNISENELIQRLQDSNSDLQSSLSDFQSGIESYQNSLLSGLDAVFTKMEEYIAAIESIESRLSNTTSLVEKIYTDNRNSLNSSLIEASLGTQIERYNAQLEALDIAKQTYDMYKESAQTSEEQLKTYANKVDEARDAIVTTLGDILDEIKSALNQETVNAYDEYLKNFGIEGGIEELQYQKGQWDLNKKLTDGYYDDVEKAYQLQSLAYDYQSLLSDNTSVDIQKQITEQMNEQLTYLEDKVDLSKYDVDYAKAQLEVLKATIALEDAQRNKNNLQLRRDAMGNYSYVYTADQDAVNEAQKNLLEAQNNAYELSKEALKAAQENAQNALVDFQSAILEVMERTDLTAEQKEERIKDLYDVYGEYLSKLSDEANTSLSNIADDVVGVGEAIQIDFENSGFKSLLESIDTTGFASTLGEQFNTAFYEAISDSSTWASAGGALQSTLGNIAETYQDKIQELLSKGGYNSIDELVADVITQESATLATIKDSISTNLPTMTETIKQVGDGLNKVVNLLGMLASASNVGEKYSTEINNALKYNAQYDTGGYTGSWGSSGKIATLHEKELVLNQSDTANILSAVDLVRQMKISGSSFSDIGFSNLSQNSAGDTIEQRVEITATFPNAEDASAIKQALLSLADTAYQEAHKNF